MGEYTDEEFQRISATKLTDEQISQIRLRRDAMASLGDIKIKIDPEMTDTAKAILREMIIEELKVVFPDTVKPLEMLREEMCEMVKKEIERFIRARYDEREP